MKRLLFLLAVAIVTLTATTNINEKSFATVNQEQGLFIFTDSKPNADYEVIATLKAKSMTADLKTLQPLGGLYYEDLKNDIFRQIGKKKNRDKFEKANALIIYPDQQKADVIKFK
jgi:hypothetical protein